MKPSIEVKHLSLDYPVVDSALSFRRDLIGGVFGSFLPHQKRNRQVIRALSDISFKLEDNDRLGLIGPNGAGKSTLLRVLAGTYAPTTGRCLIHGHISTLFTVGVGMDPDDSGYENITTCGLLLGMSHKDLEKKRQDIIEFTGLEDYIYMPVRTYSAGMMVRLSFGIATAIEPDILLIDEVIGAGDAQFANRARDRVAKLVSKSKLLVLATHSNDVIRTFCNKALFLQGGVIQHFGPVEETIHAYQSWLDRNAA